MAHITNDIRLPINTWCPPGHREIPQNTRQHPNESQCTKHLEAPKPRKSDTNTDICHTLRPVATEVIGPLEAKLGQTVRLRLVNAGNMTHLMTLVGTSFKVVSMNGQDISNPTTIENELLPIGAAERYDVEFTMPKSGTVRLVSGDPSMTELMQLQASIGSPMNMSDMTVPNVQNEPWFDFSIYSSGNPIGRTSFSLNQHYDKTFNMTLGVGVHLGVMVYTINGKAYPNVPPFVVDTGDTVKFHIENTTGYIHPMHLHGHDFQVLTRDGKPVTGSTIYLDRLEVLPGGTYDIAFKVDNPGIWMFHCHDLHHASAGMDAILQYAGVSDPYNMRDMSE